MVPGQFQRRLTPCTTMSIVGPARGAERMRTSADKRGERVLGTLACFAGGKAPCGSALIAEEKFADYFSGDRTCWNMSTINRGSTTSRSGQFRSGQCGSRSPVCW